MPGLMKYIVFGSAVTFFLILMDPTGRLLSGMALNGAALFRGQIWRLVTFVFVPPSFDVYMFALELYSAYFIGTILEREWGTARFNLYYIIGILATALYGVLAALLIDGGGYVTAHYINLAMFLCFATLFPDFEFMLFFILPVKAKWLGIISAGYFVVSVSMMPGFTRFAPFVALLSHPIFCWQEIRYRLSRISGRSPRRSENVTNFKRATREIKREQERKAYASKCEICGKTDTEHPELEFRYCSKCAGYHCYCEEHIGNHKHFAE